MCAIFLLWGLKYTLDFFLCATEWFLLVMWTYQHFWVIILVLSTYKHPSMISSFCVYLFTPLRKSTRRRGRGTNELLFQKILDNEYIISKLVDHSWGGGCDGFLFICCYLRVLNKVQYMWYQGDPKAPFSFPATRGYLIRSNVCGISSSE